MKRIIFSFICIVCSYSYAATTNLPKGGITQIVFYKGHSGVLMRYSSMSDPDHCGRHDYYILSTSHPYYEEIYAALLSARMTGRELELSISGCLDGLPQVIHVAI